MESELFGYEKGAFTGANKQKKGLFELADCGTILLDEIGEIPLNLQAKLLRALQEMEIMRVGGTTPIKIDVRIIASTNINLYEKVQNGQFRSDLFYRLNVIPVHIPPLRDRIDDIPLLAAHFLQAFNKKYGKAKHFSDEAMQLLTHYHWPGNIRELQNLLERLVIIGNEKKIQIGQLRSILYPNQDFTADLNRQSFDEAIDCFEKKLIEDALIACGSTYKAAKKLKTSQSKIARKAQKYNIRW